MYVFVICSDVSTLTHSLSLSFIHSSAACSHPALSRSTPLPPPNLQKIAFTKSDPAVAPAPNTAALPNFSPSFFAQAPCCYHESSVSDLVLLPSCLLHLDIHRLREVEGMTLPLDDSGLRDDLGPAPLGLVGACLRSWGLGRSGGRCMGLGRRWVARWVGG